MANTAKTSTYFESMLEAIAEKGLREQVIKPDDWFDGDILYCGKCKKPRREFRRCNDKLILTASKCDCDIADVEEEKRKEREAETQKKIASLKLASMMDNRFRESTFENYIVTPENERQYKISQRYCEKFPEMVKRSQGLIFYGSIGTGKTYLSACIGNRLMENLNSVFMTSFVKLIDMFKPGEDAEKYIQRMNRVSLLILDDLKAERNSDYALEKVYNIVDSRYRSGKPVIYTTNLTLTQMKETSDIRCSRIYDRIFETCYPVEFKGQSWRKKEAAKKYDDIKAILEG